MIIKSQAVVISSLKYSDTDLIVHCYTEAKGLVGFLVKGILKSKKGKLSPSLFQSLSLIDIEMQYRNKGSLEYFKEVSILEHLYDLQSNVYKSTLAMFVAEVLKSVLSEEEQNIPLFQFIKKSILYLNDVEIFGNFHLSFLVELSSYLGFAPRKPNRYSDDGFYFNIKEGCYEQVESQYTLNQQNSYLLFNILSTPLKSSHTMQIKKSKRKELLHQILLFYALHIPSFKKPKSLEILENIFA